mmetsp:Transcript_21796/g.33266  ORF Transcript_21796/g.33266 Transcript_21796/m.33266 type:complete len:647 (+) Transcript_21796:40-1980(+)
MESTTTDQQLQQQQVDAPPAPEAEGATVAAKEPRDMFDDEADELGKSTHSLRNQDNVLESAIFQFRDINFHVGSGKKKKQILRNVSGTVKYGRVLAIMGPSGAGKTTLINVLTLDALYGRATGSVTLNGSPLTNNIFKKYSCVVKQHDKHWPYLTARETLLYAAELYNIAPTKEDIVSLVDDVIEKTGMDTVKNTRASSLSGGQRRRLSIGIALLKQPAVLFLDEPTSGLDAAAASNIMREIRRIARVEKLVIVCTIHQPSTKVYNDFDQIMILSKGREAFSGDAADAEPYFSQIGHPLPPAMNPAEHFLDLVNADFSHDDDVTKILDTWEEHKPEMETIESKEKLSGSKMGAGFTKEMQVMFRRQSTMIVRDPVLYLGRAFIFLVCNIVFSLVYWRTREFEQMQVLNKVWIGVWFVGVPTNMGVVAVYALNDEFKSLARETQNGMINVVSYVLAKSILVLPIMYIFAVFAVGVPGYGLLKWAGSTFMRVSVIWSATVYAFECIAETLSVMFDDPILGMLSFMNLWFAAFLFGGLFLPLGTMYWPFKAFYYVMPLQYYIRSVTYTHFIDGNWDMCTTPLFSPVCSTTGSGVEILQQTSDRYFSLVDTEDTFFLDVVKLLGIAIFFKIVYIVGLIYRAGKASKVNAP